MRRTLIGSFLAIATIALAGCGGMAGENIAKYERGTTPPPPTEVTVDGTYGLYYFNDLNPQVSYPLDKGDRIGFEMKGDSVVAVAGDREVPIQTTTLVRSAYWKKMKPKMD